eukprot:3841654-Amphidinium_carterae.1
MQQRALHDYMTLWGSLRHAVMQRPLCFMSPAPLGLHDLDSLRGHAVMQRPFGLHDHQSNPGVMQEAPYTKRHPSIETNPSK